MSHFFRTHRFTPIEFCLAFLAAMTFAHVLAQTFGIPDLATVLLGGGGVSGFTPFFGVTDVNAIIRDGATDGDLTADETSDVFDDGPFPIAGVPFRITVPTASAGDDLQVIVKECDTADGTFTECGRSPLYDGDDVSDAVRWFRIASQKRFHTYTLDVTDGGGGVNFGPVDLRMVTGGQYNNAGVEYDV